VAFASVRPLRHRDFALLLSASLVSNIGTWMETVAVGALVTGITGKAVWAALVAAATFLPIGVLSPIGGALADRLDRRRFLIATNLFEASLAAILTVLAATGNTRPLYVVTVVFFEGCSSALRMPFQQAILPDLVPEEDLFGAVAIGSATWNFGRIIGPALAALVIAAFSFKAAFAVNAVSFLAVIIAVAVVRLPRPRGVGSPGGLFAQIRAGAAGMWAEPGCRAAVILIAVAALFVSPFIALVPAEARLLVRHGASGRSLLGLAGARAIARTTGTLVTAQGIGAVAGALALAPLAQRLGQRPVVVGSLVATPLCLIAYSSTTSTAVATGAIVLVGVAYIGVLSGLSAVVQLRAAPALRGRIVSFFFVALGVIYPIGALAQGALADRVGLHAITVGAALAMLGVLALLAAALPSMVKSLQGGATGRATEPTTVVP
jgi:MFS family permease